MKITRLQAGAKDPSRCNIYVDGQFLLAIPAEGVVEYHLKVGMDADSSLLDELSLYDEEKKALRLGLELLSRRPHSKWELVQKMTAKGISKEVAQLGCQRLSEQGYLDEEAFAHAKGGWALPASGMACAKKGWRPRWPARWQKSSARRAAGRRSAPSSRKSFGFNGQTMPG